MLYISARAVAKEAWRREGTEFATSANVVAMRVCLCRHPRKCGRVTSPFSSNRTEELWWENPAFWVLKTFSLWLRGVTSSLNFELEQFFKMSQLQSSPLILSRGIGGSVSLWPLGFPVLEFRENKDIWTRGIFFFYHGGVGCRVGWFDVWMRCPAEVNGSNGVLWWESSRPGTQTTWFCSFDVNLRDWSDLGIQDFILPDNQSKGPACLCSGAHCQWRFSEGAASSHQIQTVPLLRTLGSLPCFLKIPLFIFSPISFMCLFIFLNKFIILFFLFVFPVSTQTLQRSLLWKSACLLNPSVLNYLEFW